MQKPNAEGFDIAFLFLLAFLSGSIVYSKGHKFQIGRFILALLFWFFIIFTNEMIIQRHLSFRRSQISDIIYDMAGVLIGLSLSARWLWTKKAGKWHRLSLLG
jgi:VanZ family protein